MKKEQLYRSATGSVEWSWTDSGSTSIIELYSCCGYDGISIRVSVVTDSILMTCRESGVGEMSLSF